MTPLAAASTTEATFLARLRGQLGVEESWSLDEAGGFSFWPYRFRQRIAFEPAPDGGFAVSAETLVARGPGLSGDAAIALAALMRFPPMAGFAWDESSKELRLASRGLVLEGEAPLLFPLVSLASILQATYAELGSEALAEAAHLVPCPEPHPRSGARSHPDPILAVAASHVRPAGEEPSRFADAEAWMDAANVLVQTGARATASDRGVNARFPFRAAAGVDRFAPRASSLLQIRTHEGHPELGNGAFVRLFVPVFEVDRGAEVVSRRALELNERERLDRPAFSSVGSWTVERPDPERIELAVEGGPARLAHVTFLPNVVHREGLLSLLATESASRAAWVASTLPETA